MALLYEKKDGIAYVTLNRPEALNAVDPETLTELSQALMDYSEDTALRVLIITGAGKAFSAGADIKKLLPVLENVWAPFPWRMPLHHARGLEVLKPLIAAVNGMALGGGCEVALACDLRIASENASFGLPEVRLGLLAAWGGTTRLASLMPPAKAAELILTGQPMSAQEALRWGLVNEVVPASELMAAAEKMARRIMECAPLALKAAKEVMLKGLNATLDEALRLEWRQTQQLFHTQDYVEGRQAFIEKRPAHFQAK